MERSKTKTVWNVFKKFVNSQQPGTIITRKQIIKHLENHQLVSYSDAVERRVPRKGDDYYSVHTLDYMRNLATQLGYLSKMKSNGMYVVDKHFPDGYTVNQLRKDYNEMV